MQNLYAIPTELRVLPNWILWKLEYPNGIDKKPTKRPYQINGNLASVTDPSSWVTFEMAFNTLQFGGYDGLGFVFTNTEYSGIDLDDCSTMLDGSINPNRSVDLDRQVKIFNEFDSYSERSPSKKGLHIIVKGKVSSGKKRSFIELYSTGRYFTMTGDVYADKPIAERQDLLTQLWEQMGGANKPILHLTNDEPQTQDDLAIIKMASDAINGDKFLELYQGDWTKVYPHIAAAGNGSSEADQALINIISFYTKNREQITRIFMSSVLGKKEKIIKRKDYLVNRMIDKSFDQAPLQVDFQNYKANIEEQLALPLAASSNGKTTAFDAVNLGSTPNAASNNVPVAQRSELVAHNGLVVGSNPTGDTISLPPGLIGEIAHFIYKAAPRPVMEIAIAAALGLMAGTCGRAYNINGTGLNLYILILAKTGRGKEAAASGIDKIMNEVKKSVPTSTRFRGPGIINSGQALIKYIAHKSNCFVSVLGEFGITIDKISRNDANSADKMLYQMLLDLYNKSGHGQTLQASIYSNKEDNVDITDSPTVSILGESTHKIFYDTLNEDMIAAGLLPRFLIMEYNGKREYFNENAASVFPDLALVQKFAEVVAYSETVQHKRSVMNVIVNPDAVQMLRDIDKRSTDNINSSDNEVISELWNRAHMKIMRIAALIAVGCNPYSPVVTIEHIQWATNLVEHDIKLLSNKFESGEVGNKSNEQAQINEVLKKIKLYFVKDWDYVSKYSRSQSLYNARIIPYEYLNKRLSNMALFYGDRKVKASVTLAHTLKLMVDTGILKECNKAELIKHQTEQRAYWLLDHRLLAEIPE